MDLYTIGHSNHPIDKFIHLLIDRVVSRLLDVRSTPYSRYHPQFNKAALQQELLKHGIQYIYAGAELGGRPRDPSCYKHHTIPVKTSDYLYEVNYPEVMKRPWFIQGIHQLLELTDQQTISIMYGEENPAHYHRHHLIARYLMNEYPEVTVMHIRGDGRAINAKSIHRWISRTLNNSPYRCKS